MQMHARWVDVQCSTARGQLDLCCVLSYSRRLLRKTWPTPSWSWSNPTRLPKASPPAPSTPRYFLRRTRCNAASSSVVLFNTCPHPSYLWNLIFVFSLVPSVWWGVPPLWHSRCLWRGTRLFSAKEQGPQPWTNIPGQDFPGSEPWGVRTLILRASKEIICWAKPLLVFLFSGF